MHCYDAATFHEEPQHAGVEFADVAEFEKPVAECLGQWFAVILTVAKLRDPGDDGYEVTGIRGFQSFEEITHRAPSVLGLIKLYREFHGVVHTNIDVSALRWFP